ncbi:hypothetical protein JCM19538_2735 [Jejuia pallidilutea]|uniref:Uncharacterized protein n=1 Tax=Jejuia pallidilutea TaxID=504487 RepID=A0A098LW12_9FLAO|nr:hypothetical protein JCM19538_2735 [Jejuia pallidilutea]
MIIFFINKKMSTVTPNSKTPRIKFPIRAYSLWFKNNINWF